MTTRSITLKLAFLIVNVALGIHGDRGPVVDRQSRAAKVAAASAGQRYRRVRGARTERRLCVHETH